MKKSLNIILIFVILTAAAFVSAGEIDEILKYFKAETSTDKVIVKWSTKKETEVKEFVVQRSMDEFTYTDLKKQNKIGENKEYQHIDNTLFKSSSRIYYYRIKVVKNDNSILYSKTVKIIPKISGIRQTWGTLKAIFK